MSNIEKIKAEIERLMKETDTGQFGIGGRCMCRIILDFIDSLPEEKPSEDLELTWEDMRAIRIIKDHLTASINGPMWDSKEFYEEILRRFNKAKNKK